MFRSVFTLALAAAAVPQAARAAPFTLVCKVQTAQGLIQPNHGQTVNLPLLVNPEEGSVNHHRAVITEAMIRWSDDFDPKSETLSYLIDRKTFVIGIYDPAGIRLMQGTCAGAHYQQVQMPAPLSPQQQSFTLACRFEEVAALANGHSVPIEPSFLVDPTAGKVNGFTASITNTQIRLRQASNGILTTIVINRVTGGAGILSSTGALLLTGLCARATERKF